ncbi:MAG: hypothetical protein CMP49_03845 [Flavobacteriales bacterium]|jgi:hypothetical protein|nr:hypothetical protein [Flavobacteriales bacterium]|tara:strand:- start:300 stop:572 length:273 start_codon:yes stop_codon:yes gene_type:complete
MFFKNDSPLFGLFIGVVVPIIFYFIQTCIIPLTFGKSFSSSSMQLFALVVNLPIFRYYIINLKFEKTAKGILFATFIYGIIWVYLNKGAI